LKRLDVASLRRFNVRTLKRLKDATSKRFKDATSKRFKDATSKRFNVSEMAMCEGRKLKKNHHPSQPPHGSRRKL
jgi:hypothetical protein